MPSGSLGICPIDNGYVGEVQREYRNLLLGTRYPPQSQMRTVDGEGQPVAFWPFVFMFRLRWRNEILLGSNGRAIRFLTAYSTL